MVALRSLASSSRQGRFNLQIVTRTRQTNKPQPYRMDQPGSSTIEFSVPASPHALALHAASLCLASLRFFLSRAIPFSFFCPPRPLCSWGPSSCFIHLHATSPPFPGSSSSVSFPSPGVSCRVFASLTAMFFCLHPLVVLFLWTPLLGFRCCHHNSFFC